jgi:Fur family transcriptional regulator, peroxide stress response regulator
MHHRILFLIIVTITKKDEAVIPNQTLRITRQRKVILEELRKLTSHPTADELYRLVRKRLPSVSLGTVYRNLEILSESGIIMKVELAGAQKRFDGRIDNHYHVRCARCGRVDDVVADTIPSIDAIAKKASDYEVFGHRLEFVGLCPDCREDVQDAKEVAGKEREEFPQVAGRS